MHLLLERLNQDGKAITPMPRTLPLLPGVSRAVMGVGWALNSGYREAL